MSRHSKNNTSSSVFTYAERKMVKDFGTQKQRIGTDSQLKFGMCSLYIHKVQNPLCCNKGHVFCKECVFENILQQQKQYEQKMQLYELHQQELKRKELSKDIEKQEQTLHTFEKMEGQFDPSTRQEMVLKLLEKQIKEPEKLTSQQIIQNHTKQLLQATKEELTKKNFWMQISESADQKQGAQEECKSVEKPTLKIVCPGDQHHHITIKKLIKLNVLEDKEEFVCQVCRKQLQYQKIAAPKSCGHVMCHKCLETSCQQSKLCPVCTKECTSEDIVSIRPSDSSFTAHNQVEAKKSTPALRI